MWQELSCCLIVRLLDSRRVKEYWFSQLDFSGTDFEEKAKEIFLYWATKMWMCASILEWDPLKENIA